MKVPIKNLGTQSAEYNLKSYFRLPVQYMGDTGTSKKSLTQPVQSYCPLEMSFRADAKQWTL